MNELATMRTIFMGSAEFSLPILEALAGKMQVIGVITQPDKPAGRGRALTPPPVKILANYLNIPIIQPSKLREPAVMEQIHAWTPELIVVAAFGQILRQEVLDIPRFGCINVHASLLPRWRGASPVQASILSGDQVTGVTIMQMDQGVDTGPILCQREMIILPDDTSATLGAKLASLGGQLLLEVLPSYFQGDLTPQLQPEEGVTYAPMVRKEQGHLDFSLSAVKLARQVRAFNPWPGTFIYWNDQIFKIHKAHSVAAPSKIPGQHQVYNGLPGIATIDGLLILDEVQPAGKKIMPGDVFLRGARGWE